MKKILIIILVLFNLQIFAEENLISIPDEFIMSGASQSQLVKKNVILSRVKQTKMFKPISVLPRIEGKSISGLDLQNWNRPVYKSFSAVYRNSFGLIEANYEFVFSFNYGGEYNGRGKYIDALYIYPKNIDIAFGLKFSSKSKVISISNIGTMNDPVVSMLVEVDYSIWNGIRTIKRSEIFFITGNGEISKVPAE